MRGLSGVSGRGAASGARGGGGAARSPGGFSVDGPGAVAGGTKASAAAATTPATALGLSLLAMQEHGSRRNGRDAAAQRRAASLLDELQGLQAELLGGQPDALRLARLAALQTGEEGVDPQLNAIVRAIALRARVEIARRMPDMHRSKAVS